MKYTTKNLPSYFSFTVDDRIYMCDLDIFRSSVIWLDDFGLMRAVSYENYNIAGNLNSGNWKIKNIIK